MNLPTNKSLFFNPPLSFLRFSLAALLIGGCAGKPWGDPADGMKRDLALTILEDLREDEQLRGNCVDADVNIFFTSHVQNRALKGYVQLMQPSWIKFVTSNPFGQPLFIFLSDGNQFSYTDTTSKLFMDGKLAAFTENMEIPHFVHQRPWGEWLTGRLPATGDITGIRKDSDGRGVWISYSGRPLENTMDEASYSDHLLIDMENHLLTKRIYTSEQGAIEAEISYEHWSATVPGQPEKIIVTRLDYGGRLEIEFVDPQVIDGCRNADFSLDLPTGFHHIRVGNELH